MSQPHPTMLCFLLWFKTDPTNESYSRFTDKEKLWHEQYNSGCTKVKICASYTGVENTFFIVYFLAKKKKKLGMKIYYRPQELTYNFCLMIKNELLDLNL